MRCQLLSREPACRRHKKNNPKVFFPLAERPKVLFFNTIQADDLLEGPCPENPIKKIENGQPANLKAVVVKRSNRSNINQKCPQSAISAI